MATIRDVAAHAGVSTATVSYVLNGQGAIPAETRARVIAAVVALDYQPRHAARALRGRSRTLGISMASGYDRLADPAMAEVLAGMAHEASQQGLALLLIPRNDDVVRTCVMVARSGQVDGVLICDPGADDARVDALHHAGVMAVSLAPQGDAWVMSDIAHGMQLAVQHLVGLGHRHIALIAPDVALATSEWYVDGFVVALERADLSVLDGGVVSGGSREVDGEAAMLELMNAPELPTAVIAASDELAYGAMRVVRDAGLVVGRDVSLIGFDDLPPAAYMQPPLTTIRQPRFAMGETAVRMLVAQLAGAPAQTQLLAPTLMVRASTGIVG
ncbi:MAG: LacI family DNA-binding transcriptional regulator [Roseiflexaceae bacterium]|jgi:DNA-binding LacI/PurR family transcriptional regulator